MKLVGEGVHANLRARRIEEAARLLEVGGATIAQIAAKEVFETTSAFSKAFSIRITE